jgi:hypothetical protein
MPLTRPAKNQRCGQTICNAKGPAVPMIIDRSSPLVWKKCRAICFCLSSSRDALVCSMYKVCGEMRMHRPPAGTDRAGNNRRYLIPSHNIARCCQNCIRAEPDISHALNAIGLCAKVAIIFGVNLMFLVIASRVGLQSAGTCSGFRAALLGIVAFRKLRSLLILIRDPAHRRPDGAASAPSFPDAPAPPTTA